MLSRTKRTVYTWRGRNGPSHFNMWLSFGLRLSFLLVVCLLAQISYASPAQVTRSDDDLLLISLQLDSVSLSNELEAYLDIRGVLLPLGEVCRLLALGITVNPDDGTAKGFLIDEKRAFLLDMSNQSITVGGKQLAYDPAKIELHHNDIYVESELLGDWLTVRLNVDKNAARARAVPRELLPIQLRMDRERRAQQLPGDSQTQDPGYPRASSPHRIWSEPFIDQSISMRGGSKGASNIQYSTVATSNVLGLDGSFYLNGGNGGSPTASSIVLDRVDPDGALLGSLHARDVQLGNIFSPSLPLISSGRSGTGLVISQYPITQQRQFDTHTFQGHLQPGWDVELFRGNTLIGYQTSGESGQYEFADVPVLFGMNDFRLAFHGPNGEQKEDSQRFLVGESMIKPGQQYGLISLCRKQSGGTNLIVENDLGLTKNLSTSLAMAQIQMPDGNHYYQSVGLRGFWGGMAGISSIAFGQAGGWGAETRLQTILKSTSVTLSHSQFNNFSSEVVPSTDGNGLLSRSELRLDGLSLPSFLHLLPASLSVSRDKQKSGYSTMALSGRLSTYTKSVWLSNAFSFQQNGDQAATANGLFLSSSRIGKTTVRCEVNYNILPFFRLVGEVFDFAVPFAGHSFMNFQIRHQSGKRIGYGGSISRSVGGYSLGFSFGSDDSSALLVGTTLSVGLGRDPRTGDLEITSQPMAQQGVLSARVFMDTNQNGKMDSDEKPLQGVGFQLDGLMNKEVTNDHGVAFIPRLTPYRLLDVTVATATLDDPLLRPSIKGIRVLPRPGNVTLIDFPVIATGEVSGTVRSRRADGLREASGVNLDIVDSTGAVIQSTRTAYDGFYTIVGVPAGKYTLRVSAEQEQRLKLSSQPREVIVPPEGAYLDGIDLVLEPVAQ